MTSRLTLAALAFSLLSTTTLVLVAETDASSPKAAATRYVQLDRVVITAPRLMAKA